MVCRTAENHLGTGNHGKFGGIRRLGTIAREGCPGPFSIEEEEELLLWRLAQREHLEKKHLERKVYFLLVSLGQTCRILQFCVQGGPSLGENQTTTPATGRHTWQARKWLWTSPEGPAQLFQMITLSLSLPPCDLISDSVD